MNSVLTTRNLLEAAVASDAAALRRFVNVSSFAVYSPLGLPKRRRLDESTPLESHPAQRDDPYGYAKLKQEQIVQRYSQQFGVPYVTLRPGAVYGPGKTTLSGRIGIDTFGVFLHMGGSKQIPFTYVDNCSEAIVLAGLVPGIEGQAINIVDDEQPTSGEFLSLYKRQVRRFLSLPVPYPLAYMFCALWEDYSDRTLGQLPPRFNRRRCAAEWRGHGFSNDRAKSLLGWAPKVSFAEGSRRLFNSLRGLN
jgi:nucleoside-diphosphate-sugar epimerase